MNYYTAHISLEHFREFGNQVPEEYGFSPVEADSAEEAALKTYMEDLDPMGMVEDATERYGSIAVSNPGVGEFHSETTWELFNLKVEIKKVISKVNTGASDV